MVWDAIIASYLFLAGLGAGAYAVAVLAGWMKPAAEKIKKIGLFVAPIAVAVGTLLLVVDAKAGLQNPLRFFFLFSNFSSIMTWGTLILCVFLAVSAVTLIVMLVKKKTPKWLDIVGLVCSVGVAVYTGMLLGDAVGFPLWNPIVLPLLFLVSAASAGFAAVVIIGYFVAPDEVPNLKFLHKTNLIFPLLEAVLIGALLAVTVSTTGSAALAAQLSVDNLVSGQYALLFWVGLLFVGIVFPLFVEVYQLSKNKAKLVAGVAAEVGAAGATSPMAQTSNAAKPLAIAGEAGVLIGGFLLRYLVIMAAVPILTF